MPSGQPTEMTHYANVLHFNCSQAQSFGTHMAIEYLLTTWFFSMWTFQPLDHGWNNSMWLFFILQQHSLLSIINCKNYWHPINLFSTINSNFWANWADWSNKFLDIFSRIMIPHFGTVSSLSMISIQVFFYKIFKFHPNISKVWYCIGHK